MLVKVCFLLFFYPSTFWALWICTFRSVLTKENILFLCFREHLLPFHSVFILSELQLSLLTVSICLFFSLAFYESFWSFSFITLICFPLLSVLFFIASNSGFYLNCILYYYDIYSFYLCRLSFCLSLLLPPFFSLMSYILFHFFLEPTCV